MDINLRVSEGKLYSYYLDVLAPVVKLNQSEKRVLSSLLLLYYKNQHIPDLDEVILQSDSRRGIREALGLSTASFNNIICALKKKGLIKGKHLNRDLLKFPERREGSQEEVLTVTYKLHVVK